VHISGKDENYKDQVVESMSSVKESANGDVHANQFVSNSAVDLAKVSVA
jgi:hypothetical protein